MWPAHTDLMYPLYKWSAKAHGYLSVCFRCHFHESACCIMVVWQMSSLSDTRIEVETTFLCPSACSFTKYLLEILEVDKPSLLGQNLVRLLGALCLARLELQLLSISSSSPVLVGILSSWFKQNHPHSRHLITLDNWLGSSSSALPLPPTPAR